LCNHYKSDHKQTFQKKFVGYTFAVFLGVLLLEKHVQNKVIQTAWKRWKIINKAVGEFYARAISVFFYFSVLVPFAAGVRIFSDPLNVKKTQPQWVQRQPVAQTLEDAGRQF
jgi:hypothetical protein